MPRNLPQDYLDTVAAGCITREPQCKVEIEYGGSYHDISADVVSVEVTHTMEARAGEAQVRVANPERLYSRLWSNQADPPADAGRRIRIWMTNAPADFIQVFQGYIVSGGNTVNRGEPEVTTLHCMDAGRKAWLGEITMEPVLGRAAPSGGIYRVRRNAAERQINVLVANILKHPGVGFVDAEISLAPLDYPVFEWKPGTFNPMADILQLLGAKHHYLRVDHEGKAVSAPIIPAGPSSWTYGALGSNPLLASFEEQWREPERMASIVNVIGHQLAAVPELNPDPVKIWEHDCYYTQGDKWWGEWAHDSNCEDWYFTTDPPPTAYGDLFVKTPSGHLEDVNLVVFAGMREPPNETQGIARVYWQGTCYADDYVHVEVWGHLRNATEGDYRGTATNSALDAAGYTGAIDEQNDYLGDDEACEWLARRLATWLCDECYPATLVAPCNLVHEPGDLITVGLDDAGGGSATAVDYVVVTHRIEYERGKANTSTLELVRDTGHLF
jgi:hypothetical protein